MKTLFVNPPSFEKFDGWASARYQATRDITSFWYPVWLAYPASLVRESRLLDGPAQGISPDDIVAIARDYEFKVLMQRNNLDSLRALSEEVPWILRF